MQVLVWLGYLKPYPHLNRGLQQFVSFSHVCYDIFVSDIMRVNKYSVSDIFLVKISISDNIFMVDYKHVRFFYVLNSYGQKCFGQVK